MSRIFNTTLSDARTRLAAAQHLSERPDPWSADPSAPHPDHMPHIAEAVASGAMDGSTVEMIDKQIRALPESVQDEITAAADEPIATLVTCQGPERSCAHCATSSWTSSVPRSHTPKKTTSGSAR